MATSQGELDRPAFYALRSGGWRDLVTLLHPPYTAWHLSYVAIGAAVAPHVYAGRLIAALAAFFLAVGERQPLGLALHEPHLSGELGQPGEMGARPVEHRLALIEADDLAATAPGEREGDHARTRGDIEHALAGARVDRPNERVAPARILAEAEHRAHTVVGRGQALEELERVTLAR